MIGLGFLIWQLNKMPPASQLAGLLKQVGAKWVSIKVADGEKKFNQEGGNDKKLLAFIETLRSENIVVGGWHYVYPSRCGPQGGLVSERIQKLKLDHLLIDAEGEWKIANPGQYIDLYLASLDVNKKFPVGLCSYRRPDLHLEFPFHRFLKNDRVKFSAPQMYWILNHSPDVEIKRSQAEYEKLTDKPFIPIGCTFDYGKWSPSCQDLRTFVDTCQELRLYTYGFYSLDWIIEHNRMDWLEAIAGAPVPVPDPDPIPDPAGEFKMRVTVGTLNVRSGPGTSYQDLGDLHEGDVITVQNVAGSSAWVHIGNGRWACVQLGKYRHLEPVGSD